MSQVEVRVLGPRDASLLGRLAPEVFDNPIDPRWTAEFFADSRHHLAVGVDAGTVIGMASGVHYVHPDKPAELWINEVGVAESHRGQGVGRRLLAALLAHAKRLGCQEAWVLTDTDNLAARRMYVAAGGIEGPATTLMYAFDLLTDDEPDPEGSHPDSYSNAPEDEPMADHDIPDLTPMVMQIARASLAALTTPEAAEQLATFSRNYHDALVARGFSEADAISLVAAHGAALVRGGK